MAFRLLRSPDLEIDLPQFEDRESEISSGEAMSGMRYRTPQRLRL